MITVNFNKKANAIYELDILKNNVTFFYCLLEFWNKEDFPFSSENLKEFKEYLTEDIMNCSLTFENISKIAHNNMSEAPNSKGLYEIDKYGNKHNLITEGDKNELLNSVIAKNY